jgi:hypothetical protein
VQPLLSDSWMWRDHGAPERDQGTELVHRQSQRVERVLDRDDRPAEGVGWVSHGCGVFAALAANVVGQGGSRDGEYSPRPSTFDRVREGRIGGPGVVPS